MTRMTTKRRLTEEERKLQWYANGDTKVKTSALDWKRNTNYVGKMFGHWLCEKKLKEPGQYWFRCSLCGARRIASPLSMVRSNKCMVCKVEDYKKQPHQDRDGYMLKGRELTLYPLPAGFTSKFTHPLADTRPHRTVMSEVKVTRQDEKAGFLTRTRRRFANWIVNVAARIE